MRRWAAPVSALAGLVGAGLALAGCGGTAGDLIALRMSGGANGGVAGANGVRIVITNDGRARCNSGDLRQITSDDLLDAREVERDIYDLARRGRSYPPTRRGERRFEARTDDGSVRWAEASAGLPPVLSRVELLTLRLSRRLCTGR
jgi:hypothetical protein